MANLAQIVNVLQSIILTNEEKMILTPTYHVFDMYKVHMDADYIPMELTCDTIKVGGKGDRALPMLSASASKDATGTIHIPMANVDTDNDQTVTIRIPEEKLKVNEAKVLTGKTFDAYNTLDTPNEVVITDFKGAKMNKNGEMVVKMPSKYIVMIELN